MFSEKSFPRVLLFEDQHDDQKLLSFKSPSLSLSLRGQIFWRRIATIFSILSLSLAIFHLFYKFDIGELYNPRTVEDFLKYVPIIGMCSPLNGHKECSVESFTDGHNDFPIWLRVFHGNHIYGFNKSSSIDGQVDFPRLQKGRLSAQFWSVYVPWYVIAYV